MRKTLLVLLCVGLVAAAAYLLAWPVPVEPQRWSAPADPGFTGPYARNEALKDVERLLPEELAGPAEVIADGEGNLYTGVADGRILRLDSAALEAHAIALTSGRPLGLLRSPTGAMVIADGLQGLVAARKREHGVLSAEAGGVPFRYVNDVVLAADNRIYFTDSSSKFGHGRTWADFVEHGAHGRLLRYDEQTQHTETVLSGLHFPTGLALAPDGQSLLICEASEYRVLRHWLAGERAGQTDTFLENLPGFPFAISWNDRDLYWLALYSPRISLLDAWAGNPWLRKAMFRLPRDWQPKPARHAFVLGVDPSGKVVHNLQYRGDDAYAPITSVLEHDGWLYFGSVTDKGIGRIRVPGVAK